MNKDKTRPFQRLDRIILGVILAIALAARLYNINTPLADYHSWRQVDTAAVARNFVRDGFNLLEPRYDDLSSIQSGKENPKGLRYVEFPIYNAMFAGLYKLMPFISLEVWGRIVSIVMSLATLAVIYYLCHKESGRITAIAAGIVFAIFPYFVFFSRTVLPESTALGFMFLAIFWMYQHGKAEVRWYRITSFGLSVLFFALSILVKPTTIFYGLVIGLLFLRQYRSKIFTAWPVYVYGVLALVPFVLWRLFIDQFPEGIPASAWLITDVETFEGRKNIFFKPAFFRWIFFERINNLILGGYMTTFLVIGAFIRPRTLLLPAIGLSGLIYLFTFQGGNVQHEYYQVILFPALAVTIGLGIQFLISQKKGLIPTAFLGLGIAAVTLISVFFSYYRVKDFYGIPYDLLQIARVIQTLTKEDDKIVTDRFGDTTLLYHMDRKGAPAFYKDTNALKGDGYKYLVVFNSENSESLKTKEKLKVVFENDKFTMFRL